MHIDVTEIFYSIQGETTTAGFPSLFVRCGGCNLSCAWCDTPLAHCPGTPVPVDDLVALAAAHPSAHHVTITGGEPLLQPGALELMRRLPDTVAVQVETNGSLPLDAVPRRVRRIMDIKTPSSGHGDSWLPANLPLLAAHDEIKFVIADQTDYDFARGLVSGELARVPAVINFSPLQGRLSPAFLADAILRDRLPVRLNLQVHQVVWGAAGEGKIEINLDKYRATEP